MKFELGWLDKQPRTDSGELLRSRGFGHDKKEFDKLFSKTPSGARRRALCEYACRHCEFLAVEIPRLYTLDGLRSHLKAM